MKHWSLVSVVLVLAAARVSGAVFTVDSIGDEPDAVLNGICATAGGACTLRAALQEAETAGADTVAFNIPGAGPHTILLTGQLPGMVDAGTTIDGYTQPGSQPNTTATGGLDAVPQIVVTGNDNADCFHVFADNTVIRGLVIQACHFAIVVADWFSTTPGVVIAGNFIGTDATGTVAVPNFRGVHFAGGGYYVIATTGGTNPADRNLISGNDRSGISFGGYASVLIQGNVIGLDKTATSPLPNERGIEDSNAVDTPAESIVGGFGPGEANIIAGNSIAGLVLESDGHESTIRGNAIYGNAGLGIELGSVGVNPNDPGDTDAGANAKQNFPILTSVEILAPQGTGTRVQGVLHSAPDTTYELDFYENPSCSNFPREFLEGQTYIGSGEVTTDASGKGTFDITLPVTVAAGAQLSATATDPEGHTSEFSQRILFAVSQGSGPSAGGTSITIHGTDFADPTTVTFGGAAAAVTFGNDHQLTATSPALSPGTVNDIVATTAEGLTGMLIKGWVSDFLDVPGGHQFYSFVTKLVSNGIAVGVGSGSYGGDQSTLRQQMAVFLLKGKHGLCYTPPPCQGDFADVPCPSTFANWIEALADEGISGGCGGGNFCPTNPVRRDQMAPFLLKAKHGASYVPPVCTGTFDDVACPSLFADWIEQLAAEQITGGCGGDNYCPLTNSTRGQMAVFVTKTFILE